MKTNSVVVIHEQNPATEEWKLTAICATRDHKDKYVINENRHPMTGTTIHLDMDRTKYFRQFEYCKSCHNASVDISDRLAEVIEICHDSSKNSDPVYHFEVLIPHDSDLFETLNRKMPPSRRHYLVCLPYPLNKFIEITNLENSRKVSDSSVESHEKGKHQRKFELMAERVERIDVMIRAVCAFFMIIHFIGWIRSIY